MIFWYSLFEIVKQAWSTTRFSFQDLNPKVLEPFSIKDYSEKYSIGLGLS
jgi:hypothetical protein